MKTILGNLQPTLRRFILTWVLGIVSISLCFSFAPSSGDWEVASTPLDRNPTLSSISSGIQALHSGDYAATSSYLVSAKSQSTVGSLDYQEAQFFLIVDYSKTGNESAMMAEYHSLLDTSSTSLALDDLDYLLMNYYYAKADWNTATGYLNDLMNHYPSSPYLSTGLGIYYQMGLAYYQNDFSTLSTCFEQITTSYAGFPILSEVHLRYGMGLSKLLHDYSHAGDIYTRTLSFSPSPSCQALVHYGLGLCKQHQSNYTGALAEYQTILSLNLTPSWNALAEDFMGYTYRMQKDFDSARIQYQHIIDTYPEQTNFCAGAQYKIGECYYDQHRLVNALASFQKVASQYPNNTWVTPANEKIAIVQKLLGQTP